MNAIPDIRIEDYAYPLSEDRIAKYPLPERDASKLLCYREGLVTEKIFRELPSLLPDHALMVFNETRVVPARLHFVRPTGAHIEIFCLEPVSPVEYNLAFASTETCDWKCVIGNAKRWKGDLLSLYIPEGASGEAQKLHLQAELLSRDDRTGVVRFRWEGGEAFSRVLEIAGTIPIPPYLNRDSEAIDTERYQTTYARVRGSVAAPTAGLHFTPRVLEALAEKGIDIEKVCLHVGAGTFLPVKGSRVSEHPMHREPFEVDINVLHRLIERKDKVISVGTTSVRTLESLYYAGVSVLETGRLQDVGQWDPYIRTYDYTTEETLQALVSYLEQRGESSLTLGTRIIIVPGFRFRLVDILVTNFHQPESTLILLVSAFVGGDWRTIYDYALSHGFRFLSYGDSSVLWRR